ncbi:MAG: nuclear transport factor 2 family protein [Novosphingobium sp.]|nr:nuclear transport factor 2 family protein [Novosphingobium sp.]
MSEFDKALSDRNVANAKKAMETFGHDMVAFNAMLAPDLHMELPYAGTINLPTELDGDAAIEMFRTAAETFMVRFNSIEVSPLADPNKVIVEYRGYGEPGGSVYDQRYICVQEWRDDKLVFYREYMDTGVVRDALGAFLS